MDPDLIDVYLKPAQRVDAYDISVRVEGLPENEEQAAIGRTVGMALRRGAPATRSDDTEFAPSMDRKIEVGISGQLASQSRQERMHQVLRAVVDEELEQSSGSARAADVCVCAGGVPGDRINLTQEEIRWYVNGKWTPPSSTAPGQDFWVIAVALDSAPFNYARLVLRNGATFNPPVASDQVLVGLANATDWAKEIWALNLCSGRLGSVYQEGPNSTPRRTLLSAPSCREGADTIVFRKPGFWGIWHDVGHFPPELFWRAFGGTVADFTWVVD
jgi:hypothetical protein